MVNMKKHLKKLRTAILVYLTHKIALPMLKMVRKPKVNSFSKEELKLLPAGTLGNDLFHFLDNRGLPFLPHYARHDLKHVLLQFDTTDEGEACLQSFMLGNGRISFPVLATVGYAFITMPEYWGKMKTAYHRGRQSASFHGWDWNELLLQPTEQIITKIFTHDK